MIRWEVACLWSIVTAMLLTLTACDTIEPEEPPILVAEAYLATGAPPPPVQLATTRSLTALRSGVPRQAEVEIRINNRRLIYRSDDLQPGVYRPPASAPPLEAGDRFTFQAAWDGQQGTASGVLPPALQLDQVIVAIQEAPVEAIQRDSLDGTASRVWVYPVEVTLAWQAPERSEAWADSTWWMRANLRPDSALTSVLTDLFLRTEQVVPEQELASASGGLGRQWTGVYALPVPSATAPLPEHEVQVGLIRSGFDYAQVAATSGAPDRREPRGTVDGALGVVVGIAVDTLTVSIRPGDAGTRRVVDPSTLDS